VRYAMLREASVDLRSAMVNLDAFLRAMPHLVAKIDTYAR
jgi:hypothetical protein